MLRRRRFAVIGMLLLGMAVTGSCSRDDVIIGDYKLYDLDGSNQAIIGEAGMVKVSGVTAYSLEGGRIYFETGVVDASVGEVRDQSNPCKYGFIDTAKGVVVAAGLGSSLQKVILSKLALGSKGVISRSCMPKA